MDAKVKRQIILLSILLHILFLAFWESSFKLNRSRLQPQRPQGAPLILDLAPPDLAREVIATPNNAKTTPQPQKADFLSDKNALARNLEPAPNVRLDNEPYARGDFVSHELFEPPANLKKDAATQPGKQSADIDPQTSRTEPTETSRPQEEQNLGKNKNPLRLPSPGVAHDHRDTQVADSGGMSFNTYDWDFAPYMLELKERIRRNIFPPIAFSQLGMIDGDTLLRFKIYPNGELRDLELLAYQGHRSLMETSTLAVKVSAPFRKLPGNFPEPYLQVTAKFSFFIKNKRG